MQRAFGDAVTIRNITPGHSTEANEIEVRVLQVEWIECPFDEFDAALEGVLALKQFQPTANTAIAEFGQHRGHVRMQKRFAGPHGRKR